MSIERDKNALRGLFNRKPEPRTLEDIALACGEGMSPAVGKMLEDDELVKFQHEDRLYYDIGPKMRPYKLT